MKKLIDRIKSAGLPNAGKPITTNHFEGRN